MKRWLPLVLAVSSLAFSHPARIRTAQRQYCEGGRRYLVEYVYDPVAVVKQPLELARPRNALKTHYQAEVSVFEVTPKGGKIPVGRPFAGEYTELGCIEDAPALMVHIAQASARGVAKQ